MLVRRRVAALAIAGGVAAVAGVAAGAGDDAPSGDEARRVAAVDRLSLRERVGQVLMSSFDGARAPAYMRRRLRAGETSGVIVFRRNAASRSGLRALTRTLRHSARGPVLVATDHEGGAVRSFPFAGPYAPQPAQGGPRRVAALARAAGRDLRSAGVNLNFAPVADVVAERGAAMRSRAFPGGPAGVAARTRAAVRGYRGARVASTPKHFPGFGRARANTDDRPVTIGASRRALERDLVPFRAAIAQRTPMIMASHALYPALDRRRIASQSRPILTGLLRERLGYGGVVVTDSIEADAVLRRSSVAVAAERSLAAGADLVLMTGSGSWKLVFPHLLRRARRSRAFRARVDKAAARVLALRRRLR